MNKERQYDTKCLEALSVARAFIRREAPYYSTIVYGLIPHFMDGLGTLGVTKGMVLVIDPKWFAEMSKETDHLVKGGGLNREDATTRMQAGVLVHEANHILRDVSRMDTFLQQGVPKDLINAAFDIPINDDLRDTGWLLPKWGIYSDTFGFPKGLTGEQYVELLLKLKEKNLQKFEKFLEKIGGGNGVTGGKCGGCGGNDFGEIEQGVDAEIGRAKGDQHRIRKEAIGQIREAASGLGRGSLPASLKELLGRNDKKPVVPWKTRLRRTLRAASGRIQAGRADFSLRRPSKRSYTRGLIRPGMIDKKPEIFCIEDSSGSMGPEQLKSVRAEIFGIFTQLGLSDMWFCDIDADIAAKPRRLRLADLKTLPVHGRGGTDFRPGIELAQKLSPKPDILIYLTDGDGIAPKRPPKDITVIWCIVPTPHGRRPASWGELVLVSDDQALMEPYQYNDDDEDE